MLEGMGGGIAPDGGVGGGEPPVRTQPGTADAGGPGGVAWYGDAARAPEPIPPEELPREYGVDMEEAMLRGVAVVLRRCADLNNSRPSIGGVRLLGLPPRRGVLVYRGVVVEGEGAPRPLAAAPRPTWRGVLRPGEPIRSVAAFRVGPDGRY